MVRESARTGGVPPIASPAETRPAQIEAAKLTSGLYLVATPIGTARDITLRALDVLNSADILAAEDTRRLRKLLSLHDIPLRGRRLVAHHDHNEAASAPALAEAIAGGASVAFASDAGTPLISDPGYRLANAVQGLGEAVHAVPGPSALLAALMVAGLPTDRFLFAGFPPATKTARRKWLAHWDGLDATLVLFESPRRVRETLMDLCDTEPERRVIICRELTKRHEERLTGTVQEMLEILPPEGPRGEVVMLLDRLPPQDADLDVEGALWARLAAGDSLRDAARTVAAMTGLPRRAVYQRGLDIGAVGQGDKE